MTEEIGETKSGYHIYKEPNEVGGHRYISDAIGGGVVIWDTCLASIEELEYCIAKEKEANAGNTIHSGTPSVKVL